MATFRAVCLMHQVKKDKTVKIKILVLHKLVKRFIDSGLVATTSDISKHGKLKTQSFIDSTDSQIKAYRDKCNLNTDKVAQMSCSELVEYLNEPEKVADLGFIRFSENHIQEMKQSGRINAAVNYACAVNALKRYAGSEIQVKDITVKLLQGFCAWIPKNPANKNTKVEMSRAPSLYLSIIRTLHNEMKLQYNNEDSEIILIPGSPFLRFKVPKIPTSPKRAISAEQVKSIFNLKYSETVNSSGSNRLNLAKDCFVLSFCLMGINSADLYDCKTVLNNQLIYFRKKTRNKRDDKAEIQISIQPEIEILMEKYKDKTGQRVFNFYQNYRDESTFNAAINKGLKNIIPDLEFYAARHSWATIAINECKIDKYTVHSALNHVDESMRVTEMYIVKDFSLINDANRKVLDLVLKEKPETLQLPVN